MTKIDCRGEPRTWYASGRSPSAIRRGFLGVLRQVVDGAVLGEVRLDLSESDAGAVGGEASLRIDAAPAIVSCSPSKLEERCARWVRRVSWVARGHWCLRARCPVPPLSIGALWAHRWTLERRSGRVRRLVRLRFGRYEMESGHGARIAETTRLIRDSDITSSLGNQGPRLPTAEAVELAATRWPPPAAKVILDVKFTDGGEVVRPQTQAADS
jgi:hypothetical protein